MAFLNTTTAPTFADRMRSIFAALKARRAQNRLYRQTLNELIRLNDRELNDLGLSRADLHRVAMEAAHI